MQISLEIYSSSVPIKLIWQRVCAFELDDTAAVTPFSVVLAEEMDWEQQYVLLAIAEYKKFMLLAKLFDGKMVPAIDVDTVWHMHLLYTRSYQSFCEKALGQSFVHHEPAKGNSGEIDEYTELYAFTLERYREIFGKPPAIIWGNSSDVFGFAPQVLAAIEAKQH